MGATTSAEILQYGHKRRVPRTPRAAGLGFVRLACAILNLLPSG